MAYIPIMFMQKMIDFIETCTFLGIDGTITGAPFQKDIIDGNALMYVGTGKPNPDKFVNGSLLMTKQANFVLQFRRSIIDPIFNVEMADLMAAFEEWVEYENYTGIPPRFSTVIGYNERIWADNGMLLDVNENPDFMLFQVQLHINYMVFYPARTKNQGVI